MSDPKLKFKEETSVKKTRSPPKKSMAEQAVPKKKKLKLDADKAAEKAQHLRFGKADLTVEESQHLSKAQKREMYAAALAQAVVHQEADRYEEDNVGVQALNEGSKTAERLPALGKSRYAQKLKKQKKLQKPVQRPERNAGEEPPQHDTGSHPLSRTKQRRRNQHRARAAAQAGKQTARAVQSAGVAEKVKTLTASAAQGSTALIKSNAHLFVALGVLAVLLLLLLSGFSSCGVLFSGGTQVSGQVFYTAEDEDIRGAEQDYKELERKLQQKIARTPLDNPGYHEYQYHLDPIQHDPWQLTSFLTTLYDDYTRSEVQAKLQEVFKKQYKRTTWVEVQIRYKTIWMVDPITMIPYPVQIPYEYRIFHTKLENKGLETVIRGELNEDQWKRYKIFQDTLGGRPYLFNGGLPPGGSDGSGEAGIDYQVPAEALTDSEFAAIYKEAQKYVGTPYVWGGSTPKTGFDCSGYVCWVYNQNGYNVGRTTAEGLWQKSQHIREAEAKPGDLVFFEGTYDTPGKSHVGIYLGNGMMVSAGDPIKYANIHSSYWQKHLAGFGRLSK